MLNFCKQYKIFTAFCDFIPKCRSWRIVDAVKDKKKEKKDQNKNNKSKKKENKNKRLLPSWDSDHDRLRGKQGSYPLDYCIIWLVNRSVKYLCKFLYIVWETRSYNILRFLANSYFLNQQKGRGSLSVRKMNLRSHKTSVSIVTQAISTGNF